jgi:hypothetical protein
MARWTYVSPMNVTRSRVALVADMDKLWAIGGYDGMKNLSTVTNILYRSNVPDLPDPHIFGIPDQDPLVRGSVPDPDPHVFGIPGSGSISQQRYGSGIRILLSSS